MKCDTKIAAHGGLILYVRFSPLRDLLGQF